MRNVVLFTIDTLRRDVLGLYGCTEGLTPFLDSLSEEALVFDRAHSVAPYTQASFPGLLTSSYIFDTPRSKQLSARRTLISEALKKKAGVTTAAFHSNPYLCAYFGWNRGWDMFYDSMQDDVDSYSPYIKGDVLNRKVDRWLAAMGDDASAGGEPFFLWVHYMDVHEPYVPQKRFVERIDPSLELDRDEMMRLFKDVVLPRDASDPSTVERLRKLYRAHVCEVDEYARDLFDVMKKHGVLSETTVIVTTDHGEEFRDHGGLSHDGKMYEELVHVPQLIVHPPEGEGQRCGTLVSGLDISPTVLHLLGLAPEPNFQGQSLFPLRSYEDQGVYGEAIGKLAHKVKETDRPAYYYMKDSLKVIYREEEDGWEMYDLAEDPGEQENIFEASSKASEMKEKLASRIGREPALK